MCLIKSYCALTRVIRLHAFKLWFLWNSTTNFTRFYSSTVVHNPYRILYLSPNSHASSTSVAGHQASFTILSVQKLLPVSGSCALIYNMNNLPAIQMAMAPHFVMREA